MNYARQMYTKGTKCWQGPDRSAIVRRCLSLVSLLWFSFSLNLLIRNRSNYSAVNPRKF